MRSVYRMSFETIPKRKSAPANTHFVKSLIESYENMTERGLCEPIDLNQEDTKSVLREVDRMIEELKSQESETEDALVVAELKESRRCARRLKSLAENERLMRLQEKESDKEDRLREEYSARKAKPTEEEIVNDANTEFLCAAPILFNAHRKRALGKPECGLGNACVLCPCETPVFARETRMPMPRCIPFDEMSLLESNSVTKSSRKNKKKRSIANKKQRRKNTLFCLQRMRPSLELHDT